MRAVAEFSVFLTLAATLHLVAWPGTPEGTAAGDGGGGESSITLTASSESLTALVEEWITPPVTMTDIATPETPEAPETTETPEDTAAPTPLADTRPTAALAPRPPMPAPALDAPALPQVDRTAPPPPPDMAPKTSLRPRTRPVAETASPAPEKPNQAKPERAPAPTAARPASTAKGSGASPAAGTHGKAAEPSATPSANPAAMSRWGSTIRSSIERRKRYPSGTRGRGTVLLSILVHTSGNLASVGIAGSSGDAVLDRAALAAVQSARLRSAPAGIPAGTHRFTLPMAFAP